MTIGFFWILLSIAVGIFASNRGRGSGNWFLLSLLISPLLGLIFCAVSKDLKKEAAAGSEKTHIRCPACAEWVQPLASVCKHCGHELTPDPGFSARVKEADMRANAKAALIAVAILMATIVGVSIMVR